MKLISLKRKLKKSKEIPEAISSDRSLYPYGTRITLEKESISALALPFKELEIGQKVVVQAAGTVIELAQNDRDDRDNSKRIEIQLTEIGVDTGESAKFAEYEKAQKAGPGE